MDHTTTADEASGDAARRRTTSKKSPVRVKKERPRSIEPETRPEKYAMSQSSTVRVERPPVSSESKYTVIRFGDKIRTLRAEVVKTWAAVIRSSWAEGGRRITTATNRHLAELIGRADPDTVGCHLRVLAEVGAVTVEQSTGGRRVVVVHERAEGIVEKWVDLDDDHPAWGLSPRAFKVYLGIRKIAGKRSVIWATNEYLAAYLSTSTDSVKRGLDELRECRAIVRTTGSFDPRRQSRKRFIHLTPANHWAVAKPPDPAPDSTPHPESAPINTSMVQKTGWVDRPERAEGTRKFAPHPPGNLHHTHPEICTIELESEEKFEKKPEPPQPPESTGQSESEPGTGGGGGSGNASPLPPATEPKTDPTEELIGRLKSEFERSPLNTIQRFEFKRELRTLAKSHGPIAASWVEAALDIKPSEEIRDYGRMAIAKLRKWSELSPEERAEEPDVTTAEAANRRTTKSRLFFAKAIYEEKLRHLKEGRAKPAQVRESWEKYNEALAADGKPAVQLDNAVIRAEHEEREKRSTNAETLQKCETRIERTKRQLERYGADDITYYPWKFETVTESVRSVPQDMDPAEYRTAIICIFERAIPDWEELDKRENAALAPTPATPATPPPPTPPAIPAMVSR